MKIQDLKPNEIALLTDLQPEGWPDIRPKFKYYTETDFCFPVKASIEGKIVGLGSTIIHKEIAWLGHIIVHPDYRNKGIGKIITQTLVESAQARKCETIFLIATDLGAMVYEKLGFETETEYLFYKDLKKDGNLIISDSIVSFTLDSKEQITAMDKEVSGEDRRCSMEEHLQNGYVYKNGNSIEGFYLPTFGEGLIIALTDLAGLELMKLRLTTNDQASFPSDNLIATAFMSQNNHSPFRKAKRMRLGKKRTVSLSNIYNRIGGNIG